MFQLYLVFSRCRETEKIVVPSDFPCLKCLWIRFEPLAGSRPLVSRQRVVTRNLGNSAHQFNVSKFNILRIGGIL